MTDKTEPLPTIARLHELFSIENGNLVRKIAVGRCSRWGKGTIVGSTDWRLYLATEVDGARLRVHRIIFAMTHGRWPVGEIDHINGNPADNRPCNLREATHAQNQYNTGFPCTNKSGVKGVSAYGKNGKWRAGIQANGVKYHLGYFDDIRLAEKAYIAAAQRLHGEFSRAR